MENSNCISCKQITGHKRYIGVGTFILALMTAGISLLAIPLYPLLCMKCGTSYGATPAKIAAKERSKQRAFMMAVGLLILLFIVKAFTQ